MAASKLFTVLGPLFQPVLIFSGLYSYLMMKLYIITRDTWYEALVHTTSVCNKLITSLIGHDLSLAHKARGAKLPWGLCPLSNNENSIFTEAQAKKNVYTIINLTFKFKTSSFWSLLNVVLQMQIASALPTPL